MDNKDDKLYLSPTAYLVRRSDLSSGNYTLISKKPVRRRISTSTSDPIQATQFATDWLRTNHNIKSDRPIVEEIVKDHIISLEHKALIGSPAIKGTWNNDRVKEQQGYMRNYVVPYFHDFDITDIDRKAIQDWTDWQLEIGESNNPSSHQKRRTALTYLLEYARDEKYIEEVPQFPDPVRIADRESEHKVEVPTDTQVRQLLANAKNRANNNKSRESHRRSRFLLYQFIIILIHTGARPNLNWRKDQITYTKDESGKSWVLIHRKDKTTYTVAGETEVIQAIEALDRLYQSEQLDTNFLFATKNGDRIKSFNTADPSLREVSNFISEDSGRLLDLRSIRRFYITEQLVSGEDIEKLATRLGTSARMIRKYYRKWIPERNLANIPKIVL